MTDHNLTIPVITIDGPSGTGKGTLAHRLAQHLKWHLLDSGAIYRVLAFAALVQEVDLEDEDRLAEFAPHLDVQFNSDNPMSPKILLDNQDVTEEIRNETAGDAASRIAQYPMVRQSVLAWQRAFRTPPGLIADGRDMGTVVFPDAELKIYLDAGPEIRAQRRYKELLDRGINVSLDAVFSELKMRDQRDTSRLTAPLKPAEDAVIIDTTDLDRDAVFEHVLSLIENV